MGQAICRCGQPLDVPPEQVSHLICPTCSAKVRIIRKPRSAPGAPAGEGGGGPALAADGFARFFCPCGCKLKVSLLERPTHGKCPECGRVVPVPDDLANEVSAEAPTQDIPAVDQARLEAWTQGHLARRGSQGQEPILPRKLEAGLRVCPQCGKPIHMGAESCRTCGIAVPKR